MHKEILIIFLFPCSQENVRYDFVHSPPVMDVVFVAIVFPSSSPDCGPSSTMYPLRFLVSDED